MKQLAILLLTAVLAVGTVSLGIILSESYFAAVNTFACKESNWVWLPELVANEFEGKTIGLHFFLVNGQTIDEWGTVEDQRVQNMQCTRPQRVDFDVYLTDAMAVELATSQKPITTFVTAWRMGRIRIVAYGKENEALLAKASILMAHDSEPVPEEIRHVAQEYVN